MRASVRVCGENGGGVCFGVLYQGGTRRIFIISTCHVMPHDVMRRGVRAPRARCRDDRCVALWLCIENR